VNLAKSNQFVVFTTPTKLGIIDLANPSFELPDDYVEVRELTPMEIEMLNIVQTQPRARGKL